MRAECVDAVQAAIGRTITLAESRNIEQRIRDSMQLIAREDIEAWQAMPERDRLYKAAERAAQELVAEAQKKKQRLALTVLAHDRIDSFVAENVAKHGNDKINALSRLVAGKSDGKNGSTSAAALAKGIMGATMGRLTDTWDAIRPGMLGFMSDKAAEGELIQALHGKQTRPEIQKAVTAWADAVEKLRMRYNAAGGDVGRLDNWGMPHSWDQGLAIKIGKDQFVADFMQYVDRRKYAHEDGRLYSDDEMSAFLGEAWMTIATNGASKPVRSQGGVSVKANRGSQHRQIHLKSPEATAEALQKYSGRSVFEAMVGHVQKMARDIAIVETFGPNADHVFTHFLERFQQEESLSSPAETGRVEKDADYTARMYDFVAGNSDPPANMALANAFSMARSLITASRLGSAAITSISDEGTLYLTSKVNKLPLVQVFLNEVRAMNPLDQTEKRLAQRSGLLVHTMMDEIDRFGTETMGSDIPHKLAGAVLKLSGLNRITEARRRAFSITMMDAIGALTRDIDDVSKLDPDDYRILADKGITQEEWAIWRAAKPETWRGNDTVLTPEAIYKTKGFTDLEKERAATKLLAAVFDEQDIAVIEPGARERTAIQAGTVRGTWKGELVRSFFQFKTFPIAMMYRHWSRALNLYQDTPSKVGYLSALISMQTLMGAVAMEINDILSGKDPRELVPGEEYSGRNWIAAFLKGGSVGLYGDFLFAESTQYGQTFVGAVGGPMVGLVENVDDLTRGNIFEAMRGEETDAGAELVRFMRSNVPGSSLWYTKAATDRMIFHQLQELMSPGYLNRMQDRARQNMGQEYYWAPGELTPERAPEF